MCDLSVIGVTLKLRDKTLKLRIPLASGYPSVPDEPMAAEAVGASPVSNADCTQLNRLEGSAGRKPQDPIRNRDDRGEVAMTDAERVQPPGFDLVTEFDGQACTIRLTGELDAAVVERLKQALSEVEQRRSEKVVIDVGELVFIDSTGIQTLVGAAQATDDAGRSMVVSRPKGDVERIFELVALDKLVKIVHD
jgi:anti-sigma B factor antagonist